MEENIRGRRLHHRPDRQRYRHRTRGYRRVIRLGCAACPGLGRTV